MLKLFARSASVTPAAGTSESTGSGDEGSNRSGSANEEVIEIKGDQFVMMVCPEKLNLNMWDFWALGMTTSLGGHYYLWHASLVAGFGMFAIATFIVASAYGVLLFSMAELSSALPFAGGAYGTARVTMGSYAGFMVACFDTFQSIFYALLSLIALGIMISIISEDLTRANEPYWWAIIYTSYFLLHAWGGRTLWRAMRFCSIGSLLLLLIYILGSIKYADFNEYAPLPMPGPDKNRWFQGGVDLFLKILPIPTWFFVGTESINLAAHEAENPKRDIPRAYILTYCTVVVTMIGTIFAAVSTYPGSLYLPYALNPQTFGHMVIFDFDVKQATAMALPAIYTAGFGFTYYFSQQVRAMGKSGLAHPWLGYDIPYRHTPVPALLFGCIGGFLLGLRYYYWDPLPNEDLWGTALLGAASVWLSQIVTFLVFRVYYSTIKREFTSPFGIIGALYALCVFIVLFIILGGLEANFGIKAFSIYIGILTAYYLLVVQWRQVYSEEEKTVLFKVYLMKVNRLKADRIRTGSGKGCGSGGGGGSSNKYIPAALQPVMRSLSYKQKKASPQHASERSTASAGSRTGTSSTLAATFRLFGGGKPDTQGAAAGSTTETGAGASAESAATTSAGAGGRTSGSGRNHTDELSFSVKLRMRDKPEPARGSYDSVESADTGVQLTGPAGLLGEPHVTDPLYAASQEILLDHGKMVDTQKQAEANDHRSDLEEGEPHQG